MSDKEIITVLQNLPFNAEACKAFGSCFTEVSFTAASQQQPALTSPQAFQMSAELAANPAQGQKCGGAGAEPDLVFAQPGFQHHPHSSTSVPGSQGPENTTKGEKYANA